MLSRALISQPCLHARSTKRHARSCTREEMHFQQRSAMSPPHRLLLVWQQVSDMCASLIQVKLVSNGIVVLRRHALRLSCSHSSSSIIVGRSVSRFAFVVACHPQSAVHRPPSVVRRPSVVVRSFVGHYRRYYRRRRSSLLSSSSFVVAIVVVVRRRRSWSFVVVRCGVVVVGGGQ